MTRSMNFGLWPIACMFALIAMAVLALSGPVFVEEVAKVELPASVARVVDNAPVAAIVSIAAQSETKRLAVLPAPAPSLWMPRASAHVGTDHAGATERAWEILASCGSSLLVFDCQSGNNGNPPGWTFICMLDPSQDLCVIGFMGYAHSELTAFPISCSRAYALPAGCYPTSFEGR